CSAWTRAYEPGANGTIRVAALIGSRLGHELRREIDPVARREVVAHAVALAERRAAIAPDRMEVAEDRMAHAGAFERPRRGRRPELRIARRIVHGRDAQRAARREPLDLGERALEPAELALPQPRRLGRV